MAGFQLSTNGRIWVSTEVGGKLVLAVHSEGKVLVAESHSDIASVVDQADAMRSSYLRKGWEEVESERDDSLA